MSTNPTAKELLATLVHRRAFFTCLLEGERPTAKQTLINDVELSQPTVDKVLDELRSWGVVESDPDGVTPTLLGTLVWTAYRTFNQRLATSAANSESEDSVCHTEAERCKAMSLIADRLAVFEYIETTPRDKRNIVANLDPSRSTVNRAIRELEIGGLVKWTAKGYTTTPIGQQALNQYRTTVKTISDILNSRDILETLPHTYPVHPVLFADATIERADDIMPYHLSEGVRDRITTAERVRIFLPTLTTPQLLDCCNRAVVLEGLTLELFTTQPLFETLTTKFSGPLTAMATSTNGSFTAYVADPDSTSLLPFGLVLTETSESTTVSVIAYGKQHTIQGTIHNDTADAVQWAEDCYTHVRDKATEVTDELCELEPMERVSTTAGLSSVSDTEQVAREAEGFIRLTPTYFSQHAPAPPLTGWRTGFDLVDVHAGYAIDREIVRDGTRCNLTEDLIERLSEETNHAVLGPPGSGKSTVCKAVACRWYEQGIGPVFYRESGTGAMFNSPSVLREQFRMAAANGHVLVVVEDAVRAEANAIFRVMQAFRGSGNVTFLLDARTGEWDDPEMLPTDAGLEAYRNEAIEPVTVPALDVPERERFLRQFEQTTDHDLDKATANRLRESDTATTETQTPEHEHAPMADTPSELLLFLHRLTLYADPLAIYDTTTPTTLVEDVKRTYENFQKSGDLALNVGVFVNLLNAAGIGVHPELVCALATKDEPEIDTVRDELSALEGRLIFDREGGAGAESNPYRTVHETWSAEFLSQLLETETKHAAHQRVGQCITALLSLADDEDQRDRIRSAFMGETPAIERIAAAPEEWADDTVGQLFALGLRRRGLAPLFGRTGNSAIDLPASCSLSVTVDCTSWRARMAEEAGNLDRAEHEHECRAALADEVEPSDPEWAATLRGHRLKGLAIVASRRGELDTAEAYFTRALEYYSKADSAQHRAAIRLNLGLVAQQRNEFDTAESSYRHSVDIFRNLGDAQGEAHAIHNLAEVIDETGTLEMAIDYGKQSLDICREIDYQQLEAICLGSLGEFIAHRGDLDTAETYATQGLDLSRKIGVSKAEDYNLDTLGLISRLRGDFDRAEAYYQKCLDIQQETGEKRTEGRSLRNLGILGRERGALDTAADRCTRSLEICREIGAGYDEAQSLVVLGKTSRERGDFDTAAECANDSLRLHQDIGAVSGAAKSRQLLGQVACDREQYTSAENHFTQALDVFRETGYRYEEAQTLAAFGVLAHCRDAPISARERLGGALELYHEIGAIRDSIEIGEQLAAVCETMDDYDAAFDHCETVYELALDIQFVEIPTSLIERRNRLDERYTADSGD